MPIQPGTDIGRYHILEQLGEGGMAMVYKAYDTRLESEVAVKVIRTGDITPNALPRIFKRFRIEAKKMAQLTHPNIVDVKDYGEFEGVPYLVMPYLPGGTLKSQLGSPMAGAEVARLLSPIAKALDYAHRRGLVHRDVKPSNILITETGEPMLTDFGIAKILVSEETLDLTVTGMGVGTPEYMSPEQAEGKEIDARSDIYSLGVIIYELVTGRKPFVADTPMGVIIKQIHDPLPIPSQYVENIPMKVERVLFKALAKDPTARYETMEELEKVLRNLASIEDRYVPQLKAESIPVQKARVIPEKEKTQKEKPARKKREKKPFDIRWLIGMMGIVGLSLVIFAGIKLFGRGEQSQQAILETETPLITETSKIIHTPTAEVTPTPALGVGSTEISEADGMTLVYVPAGEFEMGSEDGGSDEEPIHTVYLDAFWIDQTEVTNDMFADFLKEMGNQKEGGRNWFDSASKYALISKPDDQWQADSGYGDHPVMEVTWYGANAYCQWVDRRLPTEAEWEKAARGTDGRTYPWGEGISCSQANYGDCDEFPRTSPVGYYGGAGASPYGAYDMAGNVREWTADWYGSGYSQISPSDNPAGPDSGSSRVSRGGSWSSDGWYTRSAYRYYYYPVYAYHYLGFRCALSP